MPERRIYPLLQLRFNRSPQTVPRFCERYGGKVLYFIDQGSSLLIQVFGC
jgi:hypothetical protein